MSGPYRKGDLVASAQTGYERTDRAHGLLCHVPDGGGQRVVLLASGLALLRSRTDRPRSGAELRGAQEDLARRRAALVTAQLGLRTRGGCESGFRWTYGRGGVWTQEQEPAVVVTLAR